MPCPFCATAAFSPTVYPVITFNNKVFRYVRCHQCKLVYLDNFPDAGDFTAMYPPSYQRSEVETALESDVYVKGFGLRFSYGYQFDLINKNSSPQARVLDYGCGTGHFIANAVHQGYTCDGAEFSPDYVKMLSEKLTSSRFYTIDKVLSSGFQEKYDVIRLSNVLEHLTNPAQIIDILAARLNPGGIMLLEGPIEENASLAASFRKFYFWLGKLVRPNRQVTAPPYHIFFSDAKNQRQFFNDRGLKETHFNTAEDAWPFPQTIKGAKGIQQKAMAVIAKISMAFSRTMPGKWGNIFIYAGKL